MYSSNFYPVFTKKSLETPLRNQKRHPELLRCCFQDTLKMAIFQPKWPLKRPLWPKILFFFHTTAILHAWEVFSLSGCTYATKLVNYKLIHWPYSLKMAVFWPKMAPKMASNGNISSFFFMDSEKLFKIHYCIKFPSIWINIGQVLAYFVYMNNNKIGSMLSFLHFSWLTI